jgi:hypothetical protein
MYGDNKNISTHIKLLKFSNELVSNVVIYHETHVNKLIFIIYIIAITWVGFFQFKFEGSVWPYVRMTIDWTDILPYSLVVSDQFNLMSGQDDLVLKTLFLSHNSQLWCLDNDERVTNCGMCTFRFTCDKNRLIQFFKAFIDKCM